MQHQNDLEKLIHWFNFKRCIAYFLLHPKPLLLLAVARFLTPTENCLNRLSNFHRKNVQTNINNTVILQRHAKIKATLALLSVIDGLLENANYRLVSVLALQDLSTAFDMLNHAILFQRLETTFGIFGTMLRWFASYLEGSEQSVIVDILSSPSHLQFGVSQGWVLGPIPDLFTPIGSHV